MLKEKGRKEVSSLSKEGRKKGTTSRRDGGERPFSSRRWGGKRKQALYKRRREKGGGGTAVSSTHRQKVTQVFSAKGEKTFLITHFEPTPPLYIRWRKEKYLPQLGGRGGKGSLCGGGRKNTLQLYSRNRPRVEGKG